MNRHLIFIRTLLLNGIFYGSVGFLPWLQPHLIEENSIDKLIGFHPYSIYLYLSFFFLIWHSIIQVKEDKATELSILIPISAFFAALFYLMVPTTITGVNQIFDTDLITHLAYKIINTNDTHMNCLPSLHGAITVICVYYLINQNITKLYKSIYLLWGLAICWSAIAIRQHLSLDIITGMLYGVMILLLKDVIISSINKIKATLFKNHEIQQR